MFMLNILRIDIAEESYFGDVLPKYSKEYIFFCHLKKIINIYNYFI